MVLVLISGIAVIARYVVWTDEPIYGGRVLSEWLQDFQSNKMKDRVAAANAVKSIGSRAVPLLVERLRSVKCGGKSDFEQQKQNVMAWLKEHTTISYSRSNPWHEAMAGLDALGPAAKEALPVLEDLLRSNPPNPEVLYLVARLGPSGLTVLTNALTNETLLLRVPARVCLDMVAAHSDTLYADPGSGASAAIFDTRICAFNLKVIGTLYKEDRLIRRHVGSN